ncbi:MAG: antitoxin MazE-like protein [Pseudomonadota bacterium]|jgi:hypothetical protein
MSSPRRSDDGLSKFQRYRLQQRRRGLKQLRLWTPDPGQPGFQAEARRQGRLLSGAPEEREALDFIGEAFDWPTA